MVFLSNERACGMHVAAHTLETAHGATSGIGLRTLMLLEAVRGMCGLKPHRTKAPVCSTCICTAKPVELDVLKTFLGLSEEGGVGKGCDAVQCLQAKS